MVVRLGFSVHSYSWEMLRVTSSVYRFVFQPVRMYAVLVKDLDPRTRLMHDIKEALKAKDTSIASTLRSVLADVQVADKVHKDGQIGARSIRLIVAKGIARRHDAASQYDKANRRELADKERLEAKILQKLLPPTLTDSQIDETLNKVIASLPISQPSLGQIFKSFYALVDKSECPPDALKRRLQELGLASTS
ncbi:hypothetical protein Ac2012v2_004823 [Leucoagaricus gongylophorus]